MLKIKQIMILLMLIVLSSLAYSATNDMVAANITINFPTDLSYTSITGINTLPLLNATVRWNANTKNITNVSFIFTNGATRFVFTNTTMNGTGGLIEGNLRGDFLFNISANNLTPNLAYTVRVEIRNSTEIGNDGAVNSSAITYTLDSISPTITINQPNSGEIVSAKGTGIVDFRYTPSDINLGNSTLYFDGQPAKSSTSATTSSNITSGTRNTFRHDYPVNNNSMAFIIEITDLAGNKVNSTSRTFSVFVQGAAEPVTVFVTPSGERISSPAKPKGKLTQTGISFGKIGNVGNAGNILSNPFVWGGVIIAAVGLFIWKQNKKK